MSRYGNTNQSIKNKKKHYDTTIYSSIPEQNSDVYFIAQEGDRCDNLANRFYGDTSLWWFIAKVNNLKTNNIPAGTSLRIPSSTQYAQGF
jgi:nucleoid-associated protein YgaU